MDRKEWARQVKERDGWRCGCGEDKGLVARMLDREVGTQLSNGVTLCKRCYWRVVDADRGRSSTAV